MISVSKQRESSALPSKQKEIVMSSIAEKSEGGKHEFNT